MRIQFRISIAGDGFSYAPGDIGEMPDKIARRLIARGDAAPAPIELAVAAAPEATVTRRRRGRAERDGSLLA